MKRTFKNTCGTRRVAFVVALIIFFSGTQSFAQAHDVATPGYSEWFKIIIGLIVALVAAYAKGVESRVTKVEAKVDTSSTRITDIREILVGQHYDKEEVDRRFDKIEKMINDHTKSSSDSLQALHRRLDFMRVPSALSKD